MSTGDQRWVALELERQRGIHPPSTLVQPSGELEPLHLFSFDRPTPGSQHFSSSMLHGQVRRNGRGLWLKLPSSSFQTVDPGSPPRSPFSWLCRDGPASRVRNEGGNGTEDGTRIAHGDCGRSHVALPRSP
eukprot:scaffold2873_cov412-Pavlova_lutheri.AAC.1